MAELLKEGEQSPEKAGDGDQEFEPTAEMLVHDFDDEQTLAEEEAIAIAGGEDPQNELNNLQKESDMPIEQLLALYGYGDRGGGGGNGEAAVPPAEGRLAEEEIDEEMEEDDEEDEDDEDDDDDGSLESESSSSGNAPSDKKEPPTEESAASTNEEAALIVKTSGDIKPRSDLHLLYPSEEGSVPETRLLRSSGAAGTAASDEEADEEEDVDYAPGEDEWRKTIMIGSEFQSSVPSGLSPYDNPQTVPYENEDKLLWTPWVLADDATEEYLQRCAQIQQELMRSRIAASPTQQTVALLASLPMGAHTRDDEQALHQLLQCGYNVDEAVRRRKMSNVTPCDTASLWSEEECKNFEAGLRMYGKDFHHIQQQKVRTRSVGELVQFYYLWKKTERHDVLANRARLEKKKYALHPGTTDYMDRFLDEQELQGTAAAAAHHITRERSNSRSSSPNVHSLIYGDPKRLRATAATPPSVGGEDGAPNGLPVAGDEAGLMDGAAESNGQVLSAEAAVAAAAATVLPPPSEAMTPSSRDLMS